MRQSDIEDEESVTPGSHNKQKPTKSTQPQQSRWSPTETRIMRHSSTPLTPSQQTALELITQGSDEDGTITHDAAVDFLTDGGFERPEAEDLLEQLLLKGYVYESTNGLRLTP